MSGGIIKDGQVYATKVDIDDTVIANNKTWSSEKISKINVSDAKKVDAKPTYADGTITYVKDGTSYTTTNNKQWFYYLDNDVLKQTIFIDGEELTIDGASVDFDEYVKKTSITDTIDSSSTSEQIVSAKGVFNNLLNAKILTLDEINDYSSRKVTYGIITPDLAKQIGLLNANDYDYYHVITLPHTINFPTQLYISISGLRRILMRTCNDGVWSTTWKEICTTGDVTTIDLISYVNTDLLNTSEGSVDVVKYGRNIQLSIRGLILKSEMEGLHNLTIVNAIPEEYRPLVVSETTIYTVMQNVCGRGFILPDGTINVFFHYDSTLGTPKISGYLFGNFNYISAI